MTQVHTENPLNSHHLDVSASALERDLQIVLGHLYDPDYAPSKLLTALTESDLHAGALAVKL